MPWGKGDCKLGKDGRVFVFVLRGAPRLNAGAGAKDLVS